MLTKEKEEAQRLAQEKVAAARQLLLEAQALMDEHRFSMTLCLGLHDLKYLPKNLSPKEMSRMFWHGVDNDFQAGGCWLSSDTMGDC